MPSVLQRAGSSKIMFTEMTPTSFSIKKCLYIRRRLPSQSGDIQIQKKQRPRDTELMYLCEQRAFDSPEPEGSEMMLHHSKFILSEKIYL